MDSINRNFIMAHYTIDQSGIIRTPGKYEGEPIYVPYLYSESLGGGADEKIYDGETPIDVFFPSADDRLSFPELNDVEVVLIWERSDGFVCSQEMTKAEFEKLNEPLCSEDDEG